MTTKHTEGPWECLPSKYSTDDLDCWDVCKVDNTGSEFICEIREEDNARLIAAAPDLLEALQDMLDSCYDSALCHKAQAAIAKARGGD